MKGISVEKDDSVRMTPEFYAALIDTVFTVRSAMAMAAEDVVSGEPQKVLFCTGMLHHAVAMVDAMMEQLPAATVPGPLLAFKRGKE